MVAFAVCHSIKLVHTDLKPENILLERDDYVVLPASERDGVADYRVPVSNRVRLIDFGGAVFEDQHHSSIINTRQYRSPEVLLGTWCFSFVAGHVRRTVFAVLVGRAAVELPVRPLVGGLHFGGAGHGRAALPDA